MYVLCVRICGGGHLCVRVCVCMCVVFLCMRACVVQGNGLSMTSDPCSTSSQNALVEIVQNPNGTTNVLSRPCLYVLVVAFLAAAWPRGYWYMCGLARTI